MQRVSAQIGFGEPVMGGEELHYESGDADRGANVM